MLLFVGVTCMVVVDVVARWCCVTRAVNECTNTKKGSKKQGGSIGAQGLLVSARFEAQSAPWVVTFFLNRAETMPTTNPYAPIFPPRFLWPFLVLVHI